MDWEQKTMIESNRSKGSDGEGKDKVNVPIQKMEVGSHSRVIYHGSDFLLPIARYLLLEEKTPPNPNE